MHASQWRFYDNELYIFTYLQLRSTTKRSIQSATAASTNLPQSLPQPLLWLAAMIPFVITDAGNIKQDDHFQVVQIDR